MELKGSLESVILCIILRLRKKWEIFEEISCVKHDRRLHNHVHQKFFKVLEFTVFNCVKNSWNKSKIKKKLKIFRKNGV